MRIELSEKNNYMYAINIKIEYINIHIFNLSKTQRMKIIFSGIAIILASIGFTVAPTYPAMKTNTPLTSKKIIVYTTALGKNQVFVGVCFMYALFI